MSNLYIGAKYQYPGNKPNSYMKQTVVMFVVTLSGQDFKTRFGCQSVNTSFLKNNVICNLQFNLILSDEVNKIGKCKQNKVFFIFIFKRFRKTKPRFVPKFPTSIPACFILVAGDI